MFWPAQPHSFDRCTVSWSYWFN